MTSYWRCIYVSSVLNSAHLNVNEFMQTNTSLVCCQMQNAPIRAKNGGNCLVVLPPVGLYGMQLHRLAIVTC